MLKVTNCSHQLVIKSAIEFPEIALIEAQLRYAESKKHTVQECPDKYRPGLITDRLTYSRTVLSALHGKSRHPARTMLKHLLRQLLLT